MTIDEDQIQVSACGGTVWVFAHDGSTVGRFSKIFGMDVHNTVSAQLDGLSECLHCTHQKPTQEDWGTFCDLIRRHFQIVVDRSVLAFD